LGQCATNIVDIGRELSRIRALLSHGEWGKWVSAELGISLRTAERFIRVAECLGAEIDTMSHLPPGVLYELAAPSTPPEVVDAVISGQVPPTAAGVRQARRALAAGRAEEPAVPQRSLPRLVQLLVAATRSGEGIPVFGIGPSTYGAHVRGAINAEDQADRPALARELMKVAAGIEWACRPYIAKGSTRGS
jgi:hypothetical protein